MNDLPRSEIFCNLPLGAIFKVTPYGFTTWRKVTHVSARNAFNIDAPWVQFDPTEIVTPQS